MTRRPDRKRDAGLTVVHEESVVGTRSDNSNLDAVFGIPSSETVKDAVTNNPSSVIYVVNGKMRRDSLDVVASVEVIDSTFAVDFESVLIHLNVDSTPPNVVSRGFFVDNTLVLGRTTSLLSGKVDQCSRVGDNGSFVLDSIFVKLSDRSVTL